jgi:hypothetical protein
LAFITSFAPKEGSYNGKIVKPCRKKLNIWLLEEPYHLKLLKNIKNAQPYTLPLQHNGQNNPG